MRVDNAWFFNEIQRFLQMLLDNDEIHISLLLDSHNRYACCARKLELMGASSLGIASLSFFEIDDLPNGFEILRVHHSVNR